MPLVPNKVIPLVFQRRTAVRARIDLSQYFITSNLLTIRISCCWRFGQKDNANNRDDDAEKYQRDKKHDKPSSRTSADVFNDLLLLIDLMISMCQVRQIVRGSTGLDIE